MSKRFERNRRFFVAILLAAIYRMPHMSAREVFKSCRMLVRALLWRGPRCDRWAYFKRLRACHRCPLYFRPLSTCGSPLMEGFESDGCHCFMPAKAADPNAQCWQDQELGDEAGETSWKNQGVD